MNKYRFIVLCFLLVSLGTKGDALAEVFATWDTFEADKCASIWLIKRFVDENAEIRFLPKGTRITEGIPFDVPEAKLRRYHNMSTFESLLHFYRIKDSRLRHIGKIIHDIEINVWEKKALEETVRVDQDIRGILESSDSPAEISDRCCKYFDDWVSDLDI